MRLPRFLIPSTVVAAHCDLPCGVYDPAQARLEAQSGRAMQEKYQANEDPVFRTRAIVIIGERADLAKHHLAVLWHDYFKAEHFNKYPQLHMLFNTAESKLRCDSMAPFGNPVVPLVYSSQHRESSVGLTTGGVLGAVAMKSS